jgi:ubiquinone/menaquinone biosynthesis C-methylase UbiE
MTGEQSTADLAHSYARWRSSPLGQITDALERRLLLEMLGSLAGKTLLDVGCGDGALALELAHRGAVVTGLDADPAMIVAARRRGEASGTQLRFVEGHAERLPFEDATFDRVIAVAVLCLVGDAGRAIAEMARVLKPRGQLVIGELGRWSLWAAQRRIRGWLGNPIWRATTFRSARQLCHLADAAGLDVAQLRGAIHYPPCSLAARLLAPLDLELGRHSTIGAAFIAVSAAKPLHS